MHPAAPQALDDATRAGLGLSAWLSVEAERRGGAPAVPALVGGLHVVPEFLGNRAPFADPDARGLIAGLDMDNGPDSLVSLYLAGMCGLGYGARQIVRALHQQDVPIDTIVISGGAGRQPLVRQLLADATGIAVATSTSTEPVLLGAAILGAVAAGGYPDTASAMAAMSEIGAVYQPDTTTAAWHQKRFQAFERLQAVGRAIRDDR